MPLAPPKASPCVLDLLGQACPRSHADRESIVYFPSVDEHEEDAHPSVEVEVRGLSIYTHHGVTDAEQEVGQRLSDRKSVV